MARAKGIKRGVRCYLCGHRFDVSTKTLSTACPGCFSAIKVEDVVVKTYLPVTDLQTCGKITITRRGRVAARRIQCGGGIQCDGIIEGTIETDGDVEMGARASWRGKALQSRSLSISDGAKLQGLIVVPWQRGEVDTIATEPTQPEVVTTAGTPPATGASAGGRVRTTRGANGESPTPAQSGSRVPQGTSEASVTRSVADTPAPVAEPAEASAVEANVVEPEPARARRTSVSKTAGKKAAAKKTAKKKTSAGKKKKTSTTTKKSTTKKAATKKPTRKRTKRGNT